jgi:glycosyltransferase involved in cell wall biosynthesis
MLTLDVAISTYGPKGIARVTDMHLPRVPRVSYVVSWQASHSLAIPEPLQREDVTVVRSETLGLSNNRNNAFAHCTADVILIADDDLRYTPEQLSRVLDVFEKHPEVDLATFRYAGDDNKAYIDGEHDLTRLPKGYWVTSFEIAIRRATVVGSIEFDNRFGIGGSFASCAEEDLYLLQARRAGLSCRYFPITITTHTGLTTGMRHIDDNGVLRGMGALIRYQYRYTSLPRILLKAWRLWRAGQCGFARALMGLFHGWARAPKLKTNTFCKQF